MTESGLINQGWQDSLDAIVNADGSVPRGPVALCEVQAYVYGALVARSELAERFGDGPTGTTTAAGHWRSSEQFNDRFWLPERGHLAVALDADKRPVDACASNMGHALWTGVVAENMPQRSPNGSPTARCSAGGDPDPGRRHGVVQPRRVSHRRGLAARLDHRRRRSHALWIRRACRPGAGGPVRRRYRLR